MSRHAIAIVTGMICLLSTTESMAQSRRPNLNPASQYMRNPASQVLRAARPTVSPYLNLLQNNGGLFGNPNYQTLVRPQLEQQRINRSAGTAIRGLQQQVGGIEGALGSQAQGQNTQTVRPTGRFGGGGLTAYYGNLSHYYPVGGTRF